MNPRGRIDVPLMPFVGHGAKGRLDQLPAPLVVERSLDGPRDEGAPAAWPDATVELPDDLVPECNV